MDKNESMISCALGCWLVGLLGGALAAIMLMLLGGWTVIQAIFAGLVIAGVAGGLVSWILCKPLPAAGEVRIGAAPGPRPTEKPAAASVSPKPEAAKPAPAAPASAPVARAVAPDATFKPTTQLAGQAELAQRKGSWKYEAPASVAPKAKAAPKAGKAAPNSANSSKAGGPEMLAAPRGGVADDLKLLSGVGPKLEQTLNSLGVWHFDQVAAWNKKDIAWVDARLRFKGRIERDGWVAQAGILAKGGDTEFSRKKKKKT